MTKTMNKKSILSILIAFAIMISSFACIGTASAATVNYTPQITKAKLTYSPGYTKLKTAEVHWKNPAKYKNWKVQYRFKIPGVQSYIYTKWTNANATVKQKHFSRRVGKSLDMCAPGWVQIRFYSGNKYTKASSWKK